MIVIGLKSSEKGVQEFAEKLMLNETYTGWFKGRVILTRHKKDYMTFFGISPAIPPLWIAGLMMGVCGAIFNSSFFWIASGFLEGTALLYLKEFWYYCFLRIGLRKSGFKGKVSLMKNSEMLESLFL